MVRQQSQQYAPIQQQQFAPIQQQQFAPTQFQGFYQQQQPNYRQIIDNLIYYCSPRPIIIYYYYIITVTTLFHYTISIGIDYVFLIWRNFWWHVWSDNEHHCFAHCLDNKRPIVVGYQAEETRGEECGGGASIHKEEVDNKHM